MKNYIVSIFIIILISINIISCNNKSNNQNKAISTDDRKIENKENEKSKSDEKSKVDETSKDMLIENLNKYFDIKVGKERFDYDKLEDIDDKEELDELDTEDDDFSEEYLIANAKDSNGELGIKSIYMDYDKETNMVNYMKVIKFEDNDETITLTMEEAIPIAEKFIYDKKLIPSNTKLKPEAITNDRGMALMEFSYSLEGRSDDIKIGINNTNKEVRMFELD